MIASSAVDLNDRYHIDDIGERTSLLTAKPLNCSRYVFEASFPCYDNINQQMLNKSIYFRFHKKKYIMALSWFIGYSHSMCEK